MAEPRNGALRGWAWLPERRTLADLGRWPFRIGICAALATSVGILSLLHREALDPPRWTVIGLVALAVLPWIVDLLVIEVPPWLFNPAVVVPVAVLHDPTQFDPLPFLLAILVLDMALWLGFRGGTLALLISAAVLLRQLRAPPVGDPGWLARPLASMGATWLVGLALNSQVRRIARLRASQRSLIELALTDQRHRIDSAIRASVARRARSILARPDTDPETNEQATRNAAEAHRVLAERLADDVIADVHRELASASSYDDPT